MGRDLWGLCHQPCVPSPCSFPKAASTNDYAFSGLKQLTFIRLWF